MKHRQRLRWRRITTTGLAHLWLILLSALFLLPVLFMFVGSIKPDASILLEAGTLQAVWPSTITFSNFADVLSRVDFMRYTGNSLWIVGSITIVGLLVNSMAGYAFSRMQWRARNGLFLVVIALMIVPLEAIAVPLFYQVNLMGLRNTYTVQIIPFIANAFFIYLFYTYFLTLPKALEEAAQIDGAGAIKTFFLIIVPNAKPVFATVTILSFLTHWGAFLWPLMVTSSEQVRPLSLAISTFYALPPLQWGDIFAFGVMLVSPIILVFMLFQRWFIQGVASTGMKG